MDKEEITKLKRKISYLKLSKICQLSRLVWVDGSYLDYPVRKYFEIPALNGLLVSPENASMQALNIFEDWQFTTPERLLKSNPRSRILKGLEKKKLIELQKTQLLRCHTAEFRLNSLATYIKYYKQHSLIRGYYKSGKLILESNGKILHELY
jgi:hypothetical protein